MEYLNRIIHGDTLKTVKSFDDKSVDCVITSPPYWQLRDYGYPEQWGLEPTFQEYLNHLWSLMDEIWRVLKDEGTVWINLGDSYNGNKAGNTQGNYKDRVDTSKSWANNDSLRKIKQEQIANKCLLLIPHRFAIGCIERGWILRNDIIWAKRNGMPESVTDRFSKKHEYFFFMVKQQKYYFNLDSVRDKHIWAQKDKRSLIKGGVRHKSGLSVGGQYASDGVGYNENGKNPGDVSDFWNIPTKPSKEKHYATFNTDLIDKPIIAGCPEDGIVLDPFCGTATTLIRAIQLNRKAIGVDGSKEYCEIAQKRINNELSQLKLTI